MSHIVVHPQHHRHILPVQCQLVAAGRMSLAAGSGITAPIMAPREIAGRARTDLHRYGADGRGDTGVLCGQHNTRTHWWRNHQSTLAALGLRGRLSVGSMIGMPPRAAADSVDYADR